MSRLHGGLELYHWAFQREGKRPKLAVARLEDYDCVAKARIVSLGWMKVNLERNDVLQLLLNTVKHIGRRDEAAMHAVSWCDDGEL